MNNIRGHKEWYEVCGSVCQWGLTRYFVGLVFMFGVFCVVGTCAYAVEDGPDGVVEHAVKSVDDVDYGPAYIGESTEKTCPEGILVTTRIVLDRNNAQVHISLPPSADASTFSFEASGRCVVGIEEMNAEGVGTVMVVYFDADAIPNTEQARAHIYKDAPPLADGEDIESARPVMNMVNLSATYSYIIPDGSGVVKEE